MDAAAHVTAAASDRRELSGKACAGYAGFSAGVMVRNRGHSRQQDRFLIGAAGEKDRKILNGFTNAPFDNNLYSITFIIAETFQV